MYSILGRCHIVDDAAILLARDEHVEPVEIAQAPDVEVLLHCVGRREQPDLGEALALHGVSGRVGDVHEGISIASVKSTDRSRQSAE
jgi:hypothetical protein